MIQQCVYHTATCDSCGKNFGRSHADLETQIADLRKEKWFVSEAKMELVCVDCLARMDRVQHLARQIENNKAGEA